MMVAETKDTIRERMRQWRMDLTTEWVRGTSIAIVERVARLRAFACADVVGCYLALPGEVQTMDLVYMCWDMGKRVCVPAWDEDAGRYQMAVMDNGAEMIAGPVGILQPREQILVSPDDIDFMAVPGVAFDARGGRLGHGGGHYDRMLVGHDGFKAGLAFDFQIVEQIPLGTHDVPVEVVVTERMNYPDKGR